jgi:tetratricopeptide (TPR) repeat protein
VKCNENGFKEKAGKVLTDLFNSMLGIEEDIFARSAVLIADAYSKIGNFDDALAVAGKIKDPLNMVKALAAVNEGYAKAGNKEYAIAVLIKAREVADRIFDKLSVSEALSIIAAKYAESGDKEKAAIINAKAYSVSTEVRSKYVKPKILASICNAYIAIGEYEKALLIAETIDDDNYMPRTLAKVAVGFFDGGDKIKAYKIINDVKVMIAPIRSPYIQASVMGDIVDGYIKVDDFGLALEFAREMRDDYTKPRALARVAVAFSENGDKAEALQILTQSLEVASAIHDNFYKAWALAEIADDYYKSRLAPDDEAKKVIRKIARGTVEL